MIESNNQYAKFDELSVLFKLSNSPKYDPNNTPKHLKPCLTLHNSVDIDILAWGCSILGSGGGGSVEKTQLLLKSIMKQQ